MAEEEYSVTISPSSKCRHTVKTLFEGLKNKFVPECVEKGVIGMERGGFGKMHLQCALQLKGGICKTGKKKETLTRLIKQALNIDSSDRNTVKSKPLAGTQTLLALAAYCRKDLHKTHFQECVVGFDLDELEEQSKSLGYDVAYSPAVVITARNWLPLTVAHHRRHCPPEEQWTLHQTLIRMLKSKEYMAASGWAIGKGNQLQATAEAMFQLELERLDPDKEVSADNVTAVFFGNTLKVNFMYCQQLLLNNHCRHQWDH